MCSEYTIDFSFVRKREREKETSRSQRYVCTINNRRGKFRETYFYKEMDGTHEQVFEEKKKGKDDAVLAKYGREARVLGEVNWLRF